MYYHPPGYLYSTCTCIWVRCTINQSHSTPCKNKNWSICIFFRTMLGFFFSVCEWQDLLFTFQKSEKTTHLLSIFRSLRDSQKIQAEIRLASYVTWGVCWGVCDKNLHSKMHFSAPAWQTYTNGKSYVHLKSNKAPIYAIKGTETASAKLLNLLFSWATKPEDCFCVLTPCICKIPAYEFSSKKYYIKKIL